MKRTGICSIDLSIPTIPNAILLVDWEDMEWLSQYSWGAKKNSNGRVYAQHLGAQRGFANVYMHREIMRARMFEMIDHIDGNGLNNTKTNLRFCRPDQNGWNHSKRNGNTGFLGVHQLRPDRFVVHISINNKSKHIGYFQDVREAAMARDRAALEHYGEFANLNFPRSTYD